MLESNSSSSSSSIYGWNYDIFLSFSGRDTRLSFTSHLYGALNRHGIMTFKDDKSLERGEDLAPQLLQAIQQSWGSIIVFSKRYAFSCWCLDELVQILKQRKERGHSVYPIFYNIEASHIRYQKGSLGKAFTKHEEKYEDKEKVQRWRAALFELANISGWSLNNKCESDFIENIVELISAKLSQTYSRLKELHSKLNTGQDDVRIIGICGMDEIGKITLARVVYAQISPLFDARSFLVGVGEVSRKNGHVYLQKQLLTQIFPRETFNFLNIHEGNEIISHRLPHKKVLLVIHDACNIQQLECLAGRKDWFGLGSRIIITTRNQYLLQSFEVDNVYKLTALDAENTGAAMDFLLSKIDESWDVRINLDEKMNELKRKLKGLNGLKEDIESRMCAELHPKSKLKKGVELWLRNAERINGEIQFLEQRMGERNLVSHGFLKGNVFKKIREVEELLQQGNFHDSLVVDNPGWIGQALSITSLFGEAAEICMKEIWGYLMGADVQKIGVWGMGGVGKTAIIKLINNQLVKETNRFDIVIWIPASKGMNTIKLQNGIAHRLKITLPDDEDEMIRAGMLYESLAQKGKYVLILDDLWDKLSLEEVGVPEPSNGSKLLVTTRLLDVCRYLDCREIKMPTLSNQDAWSLFLQNVGQDVLNYIDLRPIMKAVVEECAGLPLAIVTIASSMKGVRDIHEWRNALRELKRHVRSVNGMEEKIFKQLQFSYDLLGDEKVKHCFLCCALYPKDFEINADELVNLWIAEGLVEEMDNMEAEIDKGYTILNKLINSCLAGGDTFNTARVKLHDIVRDMALRITSVKPQFLVRAGMQLTEIPDVQEWNDDLEKVSLMENWELQIPPHMPPPTCHNLTTLLLSKCSIESIPDSLFEEMHSLKILDLSWNFKIKSLPNSISNLETLTTLLLGWCKRLENVPSFSKLQALKKLDLRQTNIKNLVHGMEKLLNLNYLDLSETGLTEVADGILAKLASLKYLAIVNFGKTFLRGEEIGRLRKLNVLKGNFYNLNEFKKYVQTLHASKKWPHQYTIYVGPHSIPVDSHFQGGKSIEVYKCEICTDGIKLLSDVEELIFFQCRVNFHAEEVFLSRFIPMSGDIFSSLRCIHILWCGNIKKLFSFRWALKNLQSLVELHVGCEQIEEIIASGSEEEEMTHTIKYCTLPKLKILELKDLLELKSICNDNVVMVCDSIEEIIIVNCPKLSRIPLHLPFLDDGEPSPPPSLKRILIQPKECWEFGDKFGWYHPNAKSLLQPFVSHDYWE